MTRADRRMLGPDGYRLVLPKGWTQLDVRGDIDATISAALTQIPFDEMPRDERPRRRAAIEGRLRTAIADARKVDAYAMYVCLQGMHGMAIPASFIVGEATDFSGGGPEEEVLAELLTAPGAQPVVVDGSDGVRTESNTVGLDEPTGHQVPARQVVYTVPVPDSAEWLVVVFDVVSDDSADENAVMFVRALITLFDAVMSTFRWQFADA